MTKRTRIAAIAGGLLLTSGAALFVACGGAQTRPAGGPGLLPVGSTVPDLSAVDQNGTTQKLSAERGHPVIVYFYPKDGTAGCTKEACAFRDAWDKFKEAHVQVFGVSGQDQKSHAEFSKDQKLKFPLIADPDLVWATAFGVGTFVGLTQRVSFLVDKDGKVAKIYPDVDPGIHAADVLGDAAALK